MTQSQRKQINNVFFDRDGIINDVVMRGAVIASPRNLGELQIRQDFIDFYSSIRNLDLNLFVVSNQPDVGRNLMSQTDLDEITRSITQIAGFHEVRYCTHDNDHACDCRKPKPGMIVELLKKYNLSPAESVIIGDSYKDILAGEAAGISTVYLLGSYNASVDCKPDVTVRSLQDVTQHYNFARV